MFVESFYHIFSLLMHPILKSCQVNLNSSLRDNNKAVKYSDQSENSSWHVKIVYYPIGKQLLACILANQTTAL